MRELVKILKSLSDETRLRILNMLFERECCVCEIIQVLGISQPRVSHHLAAMHNAGLLKMRRQGLFALYSIDWEEMGEYEAGLVNEVHKCLKDNGVAREDLKKLAAAERILPECLPAAKCMAGASPDKD
ncbi:MAG: winged helix-turn-helix transcriptional regulator [Dehalococcoidia bacterium]|nr:winged helix-turn-helix transcriptional regulator [Dehalococcoidia bacterium]